jgi:hypothetical protein
VVVIRKTDVSMYLEPVSIGVDIGQRRDPSAIVVAEMFGDRAEADLDTTASWVIRGVERLPLGTPYPEVADRIAAVVQRLVDRDLEEGNVYATDQGPTGVTHRYLQVVCDATGVGRPIVDLIRAKLPADVPVFAVTLTAAEAFTKHRYLEWSVGKPFLVSKMQAYLQTGRITLPETDEARALGEELVNYEIRASATGMQTGAFRTGTHDDLATALGLACLVPIRELARARPWWW